MADLVFLTFRAQDPLSLAHFWSGVLGWEPADGLAAGVALAPNDDTGVQLRFIASQQPKLGQNQLHFDLTSASPQAQQQTVALALQRGAEHIDVGQRPEEGHVVLADPEGNEFCVIPAGNKFLAECGFLGAVAGEGSQPVGYFWSAALQWPLVWDQDQETAIRSPLGGPKITWGGPPLNPKLGPNRLHFDLAPGGDRVAELDRLLELGAARAGDSPCDPGWMTLTDPDGNEFCLMS